ncbi:MAG: flagellar biosynthesis protein [Clostridiales Family XIII bacterium]|nr:flagellar biosynthesis protein [Clostridiales Family XIII bacterium]
MSDQTIDSRYNLNNSIARQAERIGQKPSDSGRAQGANESGNSFRELLDRRLERQVSFSRHAGQRAQERNIEIGEGDLDRLGDACERASQKGVRDALIVMNDSAFIVNAGSKVVVTVVDKNELKENIFTNIEGAVFL